MARKLAVWVAMLALVCPYAFADVGSGTLTGVQFTLIDLTPSDGIEPTLSTGNYYTELQCPFCGPMKTTSGLSLMLFADSDHFALASSTDGTPYGTTLAARTLAPAGDYASSVAYQRGDFTLSANSKLELSFDADATLEADPNNSLSSVFVGGGLTNNDSIYQYNTLTVLGGESKSARVSISIENSSATAMQGSFLYFVSASLAPIPEPASSAMFICGLATIASALKRRKLWQSTAA